MRRRGRDRPPLPPGFGSVWASVVVDLIGFGMVLPILPIYARRFHLSSFEAALLVALFSLAAFVSAPLWGWASDRFGRKPVLVVALVGTAIGSVLTGAANGMGLLVAGRLVDGGSGGSLAVGRAAAADMAGPGERPRLLGLLGAAFGIGFVVGPALGSLAALAGPRLPFYLAGGLGVANAAVAARRLPETLRLHDSLTDQAARASLPAMREPPHQAVPLPLLLAVAFLSASAFSGFEATFSLFGQRRLGFGIASAGAVFAGIGLLIVVVQGGLVRPVVARLGEACTVVVGLVGDALGLGLLAHAHSWSLAGPALGLLTAGQGMAQVALTSALAASSPRRRRGRGLGWQSSASSLGRVVGPAVAGAALGGNASSLPYLAGAVVVLASALALGAWVHRAQKSMDSASSLCYHAVTKVDAD